MQTTRRDLTDAALSALLAVLIASVFIHFNRAFFWKDDFQLQYLPASREVARAWGEGSFPLLSRYAWYGGALAGEFQHGVFSIFLTLCNVLVWAVPMELATRAAALSVIHLAITAAGAAMLARTYEMRHEYAIAAGLIAALNGWNLWWGAATWYPALASFAWLPWYWLALRKRSILGGGLALYCLITAGWPYTVLMAGIVTLLEFRRQTVKAAVVGAGLSAPAVLMLLEYFRTGWRATETAAFDVRWTLPFSSLLGLVLPTTQVPWRLWLGWLPHTSVELAGALVPVSGVVAALALRRWRALRAVRGELIVLLLLVLLIERPMVGIFRWPFRWLPLLHLVAAMAGMKLLEEARHAALWVCLVLAAAMAIDHDSFHYGVVLLVIAGVWAVWRANVMAVIVAVASVAVLFLFFMPQSEVPRWRFDRDIEEAAPLDPARRYLQVTRWPDDITSPNPAQPLRRVEGAGESLRPGNTPMLAGVEAINGYSPIDPAGLHTLLGFDIHGALRPEHVRRVLERETAPGALLDHMSVDGLVVAQPLAPLVPRAWWTPAAQLRDGVVFTRQLGHAAIWSASEARQFAGGKAEADWILGRASAAMPVTLAAAPDAAKRFAPRVLSEIRNERLSASARVAPGERALIVFSRPWLPGYRATIGSRAIPVLRADLTMPAVELSPSDRGLLVLRYRPTSLLIGAVIAALTSLYAAARVAGWVADRRRRGAAAASAGAPAPDRVG